MTRLYGKDDLASMFVGRSVPDRFADHRTIDERFVAELSQC